MKRTQSFLNSKQSWILAALNQIHKTEQISKQFFTGQATIPQSQIRQTLTQRLYELADKHDFSFNNVSLRNQKSRWGSCSAKNNVSLNQKLYYLPEHLRDYVLLHELAHTHQKNHSQKFWKILHNILGINRTKQARRELKSFEFLFYPPPQAVK
ncbi:M48 family metallopeptidase [bacterium]|nr:M48 family metallopeptidase [bacterium]